MTAGTSVSKKQLERAARMYPTSQAAATAVGMSSGAAFARACDLHDIIPPHKRTKKSWYVENS